LIEGNDDAVVRYLTLPMDELSHFEWLIVKNQFGVLGRMGLICKTKLKKREYLKH
jgi:hypothetical protein